ncbi:MAG: FHA domain-containing protein [Bacteroidaceae bacterium]|nr:FHA domain-containing protein [Bacteroidaceae bacterium]
MRTLKVGKDVSNDIVINNSTISRQHAVVTIADNNIVTIRDLNSTNGIYINGKRIATDTVLKPGDKIQLGNYVATYAELTKPNNGGIKNETLVNKGSDYVQMPQGIRDSRKIGRDSSMQMCYNQSDISKHHATLCLLQTGSVVIVDMNSTNGTFVNGKRIAGQQSLRKGDIVTLAGKYKIDWENVFPISQQKTKPVWTSVAAIALLFIVLAGVGGYWWWKNRPLEPSEIYAMYKKSVVMIYEEAGYKVTVDDVPLSSYVAWLKEYDYCYLDDKEGYKGGIQASTGTGFFISSDGRIMTNKHVVMPVGEETKHAEIIRKKLSADLLSTAYKMVNTDRDLAQKLAYLSENLEVKHDIVYLAIMRNDTHVSGKSDMTPCTVYKTSNDDNVDLAVIQTNSKQIPSDVENIVNLNEIADEDNLKLGDKIYSIGFPLNFTIGETEIGLEANNQSGEVTQERGEYTYGHNITIHRGASGSPVFDAYGKFAGVIVSGFLGVSQGYNHAVQPKKAVELSK